MLEQVGDLICFDTESRYEEFGIIKAVYELKDSDIKDSKWEKRKVLYKVKAINSERFGTGLVHVYPSQIRKAFREYYNVEESKEAIGKL